MKKRVLFVSSVALSVVLLGLFWSDIMAPDRLAPKFSSPQEAATICPAVCAQYNGWPSGQFRYENAQNPDASMCECAA